MVFQWSMCPTKVLPGRAVFALVMSAVTMVCAWHLPAQTVGQPVKVGSSDDLEIAFLARAPVIDGVLDPEAAALPVLPLPVFTNSAENAPSTTVVARLAYGADFLYISIEAAQDRVQCRDRAYQNGAGIVLALASPRDKDEATDEFQVLGFSPQPKGRRSWQYAFTWYKDRDWIGFPPLEGAAFAWSTASGTACFEVLIPWSAVAPYHPWFRPQIGLNVGYTQAVGSQGKVDYRLVPDPLLMYEVSPRLYRRVSFAAPAPDGAMTCGVSLESSHVTAGNPVVLRMATRGTGEATMSAYIRQGKRVLRERTVTAEAIAGIVDQPMDTAGLAPGEYELEVRDAAGVCQRMPFGILPALGVCDLRAELATRKMALSPGTLSTLEFRLEEIERGMAQLRPHAVGTALGRDMAALESDFQALRRGEDPVAKQTGVVRRAFRSKIDSTLQPYSIRPVAKPKPGRIYPVVVFLHGSASDDRGQLDGMKSMLSGFILVAPYARGTSHFYTTEEAQEDIKEVLADVKEHYPADPERIFLSGFSMGGYGVYRTFSEDPACFRGLIVLSGLPYADSSSPDFRSPARLAPFRGVDMFITHGTEDRNCPFAETETLVGRLREAGARVKFVVQPRLGHQAPTLWTSIRMMFWLKRMARK
jgi:predicted esterase